MSAAPRGSHAREMITQTLNQMNMIAVNGRGQYSSIVAGRLGIPVS
jgi:hypothetical protein